MRFKDIIARGCDLSYHWSYYVSQHTETEVQQMGTIYLKTVTKTGCLQKMGNFLTRGVTGGLNKGPAYPATQES